MPLMSPTGRQAMVNDAANVCKMGAGRQRSDDKTELDSNANWSAWSEPPASDSRAQGDSKK